MATFWLAKSVEGYFWWKLPIGKQFKSLEEYSPLSPTPSIPSCNLLPLLTGAHFL